MPTSLGIKSVGGSEGGIERLVINMPVDPEIGQIKRCTAVQQQQFWHCSPLQRVKGFRINNKRVCFLISLVKTSFPARASHSRERPSFSLSFVGQDVEEASRFLHKTGGHQGPTPPSLVEARQKKMTRKEKLRNCFALFVFSLLSLYRLSNFVSCFLSSCLTPFGSAGDSSGFFHWARIVRLSLQSHLLLPTFFFRRAKGGEDFIILFVFTSQAGNSAVVVFPRSEKKKIMKRRRRLI